MTDPCNDWQPVAIKPPRPDQYDTRINVGNGQYLTGSRHYWTGTEWRSRHGRAPSRFGSVGDLAKQEWREISQEKPL